MSEAAKKDVAPQTTKPESKPAAKPAPPLAQPRSLLKTTRAPQKRELDLSSYLQRYSESAESSSPYINLLLGGASGAGKTRLSFTAPGAGEPHGILSLNFDVGLRTAWSMGFDPWEMKINPDDRNAYVAVRRVVDLVKAHKDEGFKDLKTVVLDTYSGAGKRFMEALMLTTGRDMTNAGVKPEYDDWNAVAKQLEKITEVLQSAPVHFIAIAHTEYREDKQKRLIPGYDIDGSFRRDVKKLFDEVYFMEEVSVGNGTEYRTWVKTHPKGWPTKSRVYLEESWVPGKKNYVVDATWDKLFGAEWEAAKEKAEELRKAEEVKRATKGKK